MVILIDLEEMVSSDIISFEVCAPVINSYKYIIDIACCLKQLSS